MIPAASIKKPLAKLWQAAFLFAQRSWQTQSVLVTDQALFMGN
ncbi:hypothetical protein [Rosistilla oblonga]|nr:hypothetical protein [Rosistilla oblonga]